MRLTTTAHALREAMSLPAAITPNQPQLIAYSGVYLEVTSGKLLVRGSDGETTITVALAVTDATAGNVLVPPKAVLKYLSTIGDDTPVTLTSPSATTLEVKAGAGDPYKFTAIAVSFPVGAPPRRDKIAADLSALPAAVAAVRDCAGVLNGGSDKVVQLVSTDDTLRLHSTDRFRVARATLPTGSGFGSFDGLLSLRILDLIASVEPTHVQLDPRGRDMVFHASNVIISTRLDQQPFPIVDSVLMADAPYSLSLPRAEALAALRRLASVSPTGGSLDIDAVSDQVTFAVTNAGTGSGVEHLTLETPAAGELAARVNLDFLRSGLAVAGGDQVELRWIEQHRPLYLISDDPIPTTQAISPQRRD